MRHYWVRSDHDRGQFYLMERRFFGPFSRCRVAAQSHQQGTIYGLLFKLQRRELTLA